MAKSYLDKDGLLYFWGLLKSKFFYKTGGTISGNLTVTGTTTLQGNATAPTPSSSDNSTKVATTAFVQSEIASKIAAADAMIYKGTIGTGGTVTALPATHSTGWTYKVITAGTYAGVVCEVGDMIVCLTDGTTANDAHWTVIQSNIDGAVVGPASAVDAHVAVFSGTTGKVIKDSSFTIGKSVPSNAVFTDTHYTTHLIAGASATATANAAATNGNVYLNLLDNTTIRESHNIVGSGGTTVVSDVNGKITISSSNTTYADMKGATADAAGTHGLVPAPAAGKQASFLRGDGTWVVPTNTTYANMTAATASAAGKAGLVPAPPAGSQDMFLTGAGTFAEPTSITNAEIDTIVAS